MPDNRLRNYSRLIVGGNSTTGICRENLIIADRLRDEHQENKAGPFHFNKN